MFIALPIRDSPNPPGRPWVTWGLIAVNVAAYLLITWPASFEAVDPRDPVALEYLRAMSERTGMGAALLLRELSAYDLMVFKYGFRPGSPSTVALFTCMFLHGGFWHLAGNMLFLWIFGDNVEHRLGRGKFLLVYLVMGVVATLSFAVFRLQSQIPLVGASGAISGVLGTYFIWFPHNQVRVLTVVLIVFINVITVPARWVLGFYIVIENVLPFVFGGQATVAYGAHIGGFAAGVGVAWALDRYPALSNWAKLGPDPVRRHVRAQPADASPVVGASPGQLFSRAIAARSYEQALQIYAALTPTGRRHLPSPDLLELVDWLVDSGDAESALALIRRYLMGHPTGPELDAFHLRAGLILLRSMGRPTAAYQHLLTVFDVQPSPDNEAAARRALEEIERQRRGGVH